MNEAERMLRVMFRTEDTSGDVFKVDATRGNPGEFIHPKAQHALFGPSGSKEILNGRDAFLAFVSRCAAALASHRDEILSIQSIDEQCALVHARAWRTSAATGEEISYEWAMLYRVESGLITYAADMLDSDAQAFWGRVLGSS